MKKISSTAQPTLFAQFKSQAAYAASGVYSAIVEVGTTIANSRPVNAALDTLLAPFAPLNIPQSLQGAVFGRSYPLRTADVYFRVNKRGNRLVPARFDIDAGQGLERYNGRTLFRITCHSQAEVNALVKDGYPKLPLSKMATMTPVMVLGERQLNALTLENIVRQGNQEGLRISSGQTTAILHPSQQILRSDIVTEESVSTLIVRLREDEAQETKLKAQKAYFKYVLEDPDTPAVVTQRLQGPVITVGDQDYRLIRMAEGPDRLMPFDASDLKGHVAQCRALTRKTLLALPQLHRLSSEGITFNTRTAECDLPDRLEAVLAAHDEQSATRNFPKMTLSFAAEASAQIPEAKVGDVVILTTPEGFTYPPMIVAGTDGDPATLRSPGMHSRREREAKQALASGVATAVAMYSLEDVANATGKAYDLVAPLLPNSMLLPMVGLAGGNSPTTLLAVTAAIMASGVRGQDEIPPTQAPEPLNPTPLSQFLLSLWQWVDPSSSDPLITPQYLKVFPSGRNNTATFGCSPSPDGPQISIAECLRILDLAVDPTGAANGNPSAPFLNATSTLIEAIGPIEVAKAIQVIHSGGYPYLFSGPNSELALSGLFGLLEAGSTNIPEYTNNLRILLGIAGSEINAGCFPYTGAADCPTGLPPGLSFPTTPTPPVSSPSPRPHSDSDARDSAAGLGGGEIAGITLGVAAVLLLIAAKHRHNRNAKVGFALLDHAQPGVILELPTRIVTVPGTGRPMQSETDPFAGTGWGLYAQAQDSEEYLTKNGLPITLEDQQELKALRTLMRAPQNSLSPEDLDRFTPLIERLEARRTVHILSGVLADLDGSSVSAPVLSGEALRRLQSLLVRGGSFHPTRDESTRSILPNAVRTTPSPDPGDLASGPEADAPQLLRRASTMLGNGHLQPGDTSILSAAALELVSEMAPPPATLVASAPDGTPSDHAPVSPWVAARELLRSQRGDRRPSGPGTSQDTTLTSVGSDFGEPGGSPPRSASRSVLPEFSPGRPRLAWHAGSEQRPPGTPLRPDVSLDASGHDATGGNAAGDLILASVSSRTSPEPDATSTPVPDRRIDLRGIRNEEPLSQAARRATARVLNLGPPKDLDSHA